MMKRNYWVFIVGFLLLAMAGIPAVAQDIPGDQSVMSEVMVYNLQVEVDPPNPNANREVAFYVSGEFPSTGYTILEKSLSISKSLPEQYGIHLTVQKPTDAQLMVITPFREMVGKAFLSGGIHPVRVFVNGKNMYETNIPAGEEYLEPILTFERSGGFAGWYSKFDLFQDGLVVFASQPAQETPLGNPVVHYNVFNKVLDLLHQIDFHTLPAEFLPDRPIADGYDFTIHYDSTQVRIAQGADLPPSLQSLLDILEGIMNRQYLYELPDSTPQNIFNLRLEYVPDFPVGGEALTLFVSGEFPSPGYAFTRKEINVLESFPEQISLVLEVSEPSEPQPAVMVPFREELGIVQLSDGVHPVYGTLNGQKVDLGTITVGYIMNYFPEGTWLGFIRSGGIAGESTLMMLHDNRVVRFRPHHPVGSMEYDGFVTESLYKDLRVAVDATDFSTLESAYAIDPPIADGFTYLLYFKNYIIHVAQGATLPPELDRVMNVLNQIMDGGWSKDAAGAESAVGNWTMYE